MKKKSLSMVLVLMAVAAVAGYGKPKVFDKTVPADQCSTLITENGQGTVITKFNGKKVSWKNRTSMLIPAGTHSLQFSRKEDRGLVTISDSTDVTYTFLAGHTYLAVADIIDDSNKTRKAYALIQDVTTALLDFPTPDRASPNASPFEGEWINVKDEADRLIFAGGEWARKYKGKFFARGFVWEETPISPFLVYTTMYDAKKDKWNEVGGVITMSGQFFVKIISYGDDAFMTDTKPDSDIGVGDLGRAKYERVE